MQNFGLIKMALSDTMVPEPVFFGGFQSAITTRLGLHTNTQKHTSLDEIEYGGLSI